MIIAGGIDTALTTFAGLGLALILEGDGAQRVRLGWQDGADPRFVVTASGYDEDAIAQAVLRHALRETSDDGWINADLVGHPWDGGNATLSPRIKRPADGSDWLALQAQRNSLIDRLTSCQDAVVDLEMVGGLGQPAYWPVMTDGRSDEGASRWEMKTRNRGEDFVQNRLRSLSTIVAKRDAQQIADGLTGRSTRDEAYEGKRSDESRTATGLASPRFVDSALAWCGLWGLASFPVLHRLGRLSVTPAAIPAGEFVPKMFAAPILVGMFTLARWRAVLVSQDLADAVGDDPVSRRRAHLWLGSHGVRSIGCYPVMVTDNPNAPERWIEELSDLVSVETVRASNGRRL